MEQQEILQALFWGSIIFGAFKLGELWSVFKLERELNRLTEENPELAREIDSVAQNMVASMPNDGEILRLERCDGQLLAYGDQRGFLAQGQTFQEVFQTIKQRFPGQRFHLVDYKTQFTEEECQKIVRDLRGVFEEQNR